MDRMTRDQLYGYIQSLGIEVEAQAALADYRGGDHKTEGVASVRGPESRSDRRPGAVVP